MKITFAIKALGHEGGGAERVLVDVASGLAARGHSVAIVTGDAAGFAAFYPLDQRVDLIGVGVRPVGGKSSVYDMVRRIWSFRRAIRALRPDVVVGFMHSTYVPLGLALKGGGVPMVASEHIGPEHYQDRLLERFALSLTPLIAASITVVSEQIRSSFGGWLRTRMEVVPNPVSLGPASHVRSRQEREGEPVAATLLCVGRLAPQKGHAILIEAFRLVVGKFPGWRLRIVGEGELRGMLQELVDSRGLNAQVCLAGAVSDIGSEYAAADLFVLPSSYESFGLATAEALLHGLPAVGFADCPGTNDLIRDGENGRLVRGDDRIQALADVLEDLMRDPAERARLGRSSRAWIVARYGIEGVLDKWESVLLDASSRSR